MVNDLRDMVYDSDALKVDTTIDDCIWQYETWSKIRAALKKEVATQNLA